MMTDLDASSDDRTKLTALMDSGLRVMLEINDLRDGLNGSIKAIAQEQQVKPAVLRKALRIACKRNMADEKQLMAEVDPAEWTTGAGTQGGSGAVLTS